MTLAEKAYVSLRKDIVEGCFAPESPLRLADGVVWKFTKTSCILT